jgi:hypothetical protein
VGKKTFEENIGIYDLDKTPLPMRKMDRKDSLKTLIQAKS